MTEPHPTPALILAHRLEAASIAWTDFCVKREAMNAARPNPMHSTDAERALYDERYKADHEAERRHWETAIELAQVSGEILAAWNTRAQF